MGVVTVSCLLLLGVMAATSAHAVATRNGPRWGVRIAFAGMFSNLTSADASLYASRGTDGQLIRIDPATQRIEAAADRATTTDSLAFAGGAIWATGVPTRNPAAQFELVKFNATTLQRESAASLGSEYKPFVFSGPFGQLWSATGDSQLNACIVRRLSPSTGTALIAQRLWTRGVPAGGCSSASFTPDGAYLFVMTGSGGTDNLVLYKLDASSLAVVGRRSLPAFAQWASVAASNTRVWLSGGYPGASGELVFLDGSDLRILAESPDLSMKGSGISSDLPEFSQWPDVSMSGGRVWVASGGTEACFAPSSRKVLAMHTEYGRRPIASAQFTFAGGRLWAIGQNASGNQQQDLVLVGPPAACDLPAPA